MPIGHLFFAGLNCGGMPVRQGPRIYNLFPLLAGSVTGWRSHLGRIAAMGFDWVYVNPFHYPGFSGSLYAVKDYYELHPLFRGDSIQPADELLRGFIEEAREHGLRVMMDLVVNHTAKDSLLAQEHPEWFRHAEDGGLASPRALDAEAPEGYVEWGDLAEIDFAAGPELVEFFRAVSRHYAKLGFAGFRCDAAYQVPPAVWQSIIQGTPGAIFAAETLGCTPDQAVAVGRAGFHYLFNSAKWWDFQEDWFFEQYDLFRTIAPSIAFPESHDTPRLTEGHQLRLLFSVFASAGWMMPMGFEYGFARRLNVVETRPDWWERPRFDLTPLIVQLNLIKAETPSLNEEGRLERIDGGFRRWDLSGRSSSVLLLGEGSLDGYEEVAAVEGARLLRSVQSVGLPATVSRAIIIEDIQPRIDDGRYPVKREVGDMVEVSADIFKEGHDRLAARILYQEVGAVRWDEAPMVEQGNDRWAGRFPLSRNSRWRFTIEAWTDVFESWREGVLKKRAAGQAVLVEMAEGRALVAHLLQELDVPDDGEGLEERLLSEDLRRLMAERPDRRGAVRADRVLEVVADRVAARFAAWYEMFPRSQGHDPSRSASFKDCEKRLPEIARLGFDVVYLVPIHPIGRLHRKGPDNSLDPGPDDPGSPYAIGSDEGGHMAVHPDLGTLQDFHAFVRRAAELGMEVALDLAIQCAPDHPWVGEHSEWFRFRPDGSIQYAENPPKKYQDIVNVDFWTEHAPALWEELLGVVLFWVGHGVKIFRVDNPHTKPVPFWEWLINTVQERHPEVLFLAEAFTRPKMMRMLAKAGFSQSYTYFTWRNFKEELTAYLQELTRSEMRQYYRPHFFVNTPDILPGYLQTGGRPAFRIRLVLAATLSSLYGIYNGYELCENAAVPGTEDYLHSEKYQFKVWDWNRPGHIKDDIARINAIRRDNPALHEFENLTFHPADDGSVLFYGKSSLDRSNILFIAVNLDPFDPHEADLHFPLAEMGLTEGETFEVEELLGGSRHLWQGSIHRIRLDPQLNPAAIFRVTLWHSVSWREPCL